MTETTFANPAPPAWAKEFAPPCAQLLIAGIAHVNFKYDAYDRAIGLNLELWDAAKRPSSGRVDSSLAGQLIALFLTVLEIQQPQWHRSEDCLGGFQWDIHLNVLKHRHEERTGTLKSFEYPGVG